MAGLSRVSQALLAAMIAAVLLVGLTVGIHALTRGNNLGIDQVIFWHAGREVFLEGASPYSDKVAELSQQAVYKRLAQPDEDQLAFVYPPYALLVLLPTYWMDFGWAQAFWLAINVLLFTSIFPLLYRQYRRWVPVTALALYPLAFGLITGNFAVLITTTLVAAFALIFREGKPGAGIQIATGVMLAWVTFKPQFVWLVLAFYLAACFRLRRTWLLAGFFAASFALLGVSFIMLPDWLVAWLERVNRYVQYNQSWPIMTLLLKQVLPVRAASILTGAAFALSLAVTVWLGWRWWQGMQSPLSVTAWCGLVIYIFHPRGASYEQLTFLFPMLIWAATSRTESRWQIASIWLGMITVSWLLFAASKAPLHPPLVIEWLIFPATAWTAWMVWAGAKTPESLSGIMGQPSP